MQIYLVEVTCDTCVHTVRNFTACPPLRIANSDISISSSMGGDPAVLVVTCDDGFTSAAGSSFTVVCINGSWTNLLTCVGLWR